MTKYSFTRYAYFDTNILSFLAKNRKYWPKLLEFLGQNDFTVGISDTVFSELSDANKMHRELAVLLMSMPTGRLKDQQTILEEEVGAYPQMRSEILGYPLNSLLLEKNGLEKLSDFFNSSELKNERENQLDFAKQMLDRLTQLKGNFAPSKSGQYTRNQTEDFVWRMIIQLLVINHRDFLLQFKDRLFDKHFHTNVFQSIRLYAYVIFYKYYLGQREPKEKSDFADLGHLFTIPYCELVVLERDLCEILNQIKRNHNILKCVEIKNIDFIKELE